MLTSPSPSPAVRRRGAALAVVLVALVVAAALAAGATLAAREARRAAYDELAQLRASIAAEGALVGGLHPWDRRHAQLAVGASDSETFANPAAAATVRTLRLDADRLLVEANARARAAQPGAAAWAVRTVSAVVRLHRATPTTLGAITAAGAVDLLDGATVNGRDAAPTGWTDCPPSSTDSIAIAAASAAGLSVARSAVVTGPVVASALAGNPGTFDQFGAERWADLVRRADVTIDLAGGARTPAPRDSAGRCVLGVDAWGEPMRGSGVATCATTYALVYARTGVTVRGPARGQGVLLVDGDLTIDGELAFAGVIVVRGGVRAQRGALRLDGALLVTNATTLGAGTTVHTSRCALARALDGTAPAAPIGRRAWADVTR